MKSPEDVRAELSRIFENRHRNWLGSHAREAGEDQARWPLEIRLGAPTEQVVLEQHEAFDRWVLTWQRWTGTGELRWTSRQWRRAGVYRVPEKLLLRNAAEVVQLLGETNLWTSGLTRLEELVLRWPQLRHAATRRFRVLAGYSDEDFTRLISVLTWLGNVRTSLLYIRQIPVAGVDSKWIEAHQGLLTFLVSAMRGNARKDEDLHQLCGLRPLPHLVRLRVLDKGLRRQVGGLEDISAPVEQLAGLTLPVSNVIIVENLQTGLALEDLPGTIALLKLGYDERALALISWIGHAQTFYWGDLDTHGFGILHTFRAYLPTMQSVLMDEATLLSNRALWVEEPKPHSASFLSRLSGAESRVYHALKQNRWGHRVRLEQERIPWSVAMQALRRTIHGAALE